MKPYTKAKFLQNPKRKTSVFVRFSTVTGGRGSADTVRDPHGWRLTWEGAVVGILGSTIIHHIDIDVLRVIVI
jgi:hypothetical protein